MLRTNFYLCLGLAQALRLSNADLDMLRLPNHTEEIGQTSKLNAEFWTNCVT